MPRARARVRRGEPYSMGWWSLGEDLTRSGHYLCSERLKNIKLVQNAA